MLLNGTLMMLEIFYNLAVQYSSHVPHVTNCALKLWLLRQQNWMFYFNSFSILIRILTSANVLNSTGLGKEKRKERMNWATYISGNKEWRQFFLFFPLSVTKVLVGLGEDIYI